MSQTSSLPHDPDGLSAYFTNMEHLRKLFQELVAAPTLPRRILVLHGVGGVGKSSLLKMFRLHCKSVHVPVALASGDEAKSVVDVLSSWADDLEADGVRLPTFAKSVRHYRATEDKVNEQARKAQDTHDQTTDITARAASKTAEEVGGAIAGTVIGLVIPGAGTVIGSVLGSVLGSMSAEALVGWLRSFLSPADADFFRDPTKKLTEDFLNDIAQIATKHRLALMLDTYEQVTTLDGWTHDLAQQLHANALLVIAGRVAPEWGLQWPESQAHKEELRPMTKRVMYELVHRYYKHIRGGTPKPKQVEAVVQFARGLPMVATIVVQLWVQYGVEDFSVVKPQVMADVVDVLAKGVPQKMWPVFEVAAVLRYFNADSLGALMENGDANQLYSELHRWPFIRPRREGLAVHDTMREMINEALRVRSPDRFRTLHQQAAMYYETRIEKATGDERERYTLERLYHCVRVDEEAGIRLFQEMAEKLARFMLLNQFRRLLNDASSYSLTQENSQLWIKYYKARLARIDLNLIEAETIFESISNNERIAPKLKAYALFDLGMIFRQRRIGTPEVLGKTIQCYEQSLALAPLDSKLVFSLMELGPIYRDRGEWERGLDYINQALKFFLTQNDHYGIVAAYRYLRNFYIYRGDWKQMLSMHKKALEVAKTLDENTYLTSELLQQLAIAWVWAGLYREAKYNIQESITLIRKLLGPVRVAPWTQRDLAYTLSFVNNFVEANQLISESLQATVEQPKHSERDEAVALGFYGMILLRKGDLDKAIEVLSQSAHTKRNIQDTSYLLETINWLGVAHEILQRWSDAENFYAENITNYRWTGRLYFICGALTGLMRVKHAQGDYAAIPPLLVEAEQLARQYEYNDHLASLRLTQGHVAWEGRGAVAAPNAVAAPASGEQTSPLRYYQHALIYALRFNRFLLDEALAGRPQGTPLRPIISHCLERGEEGRRMLIALRDWWKTGVNDIGTPRPDTISPIPEGIPLLEAERIAREREPGDDSPQAAVIEQIELTLT